jgi:uncharacterized protein (TIGR02217 family)
MHLQNVFPYPVSFGHRFGPSWSVDIVGTDNGKEARNLTVAQSRQRGSVSLRVSRPRRMAMIRKWLYITEGRQHSFRIRVHDDYQVPDDSGTGSLVLVEGETDVYQICKRYILDEGDTALEVYHDRKIVNPEVGTFALYDGLTLKLLNTHYEIDESTGLCTINFIPSGTLSWHGRFHVPVRFDLSAHEIEIIARSGDSLIQGIDEIPLVEVVL